MSTSIEMIKREILREMKAATEEAKENMFDALQFEIAGYYVGKPVKYKRTYQMLTTPRADPVTSSENITMTRVYLHGGIKYTTGKYPTMEEVLEWTNKGTAKTIGRHGYWARSLKTMKSEFDNAFRSHFN